MSRDPEAVHANILGDLSTYRSYIIVAESCVPAGINIEFITSMI